MNHVYGIELDVQETADHPLVVFHDADLQRLCQNPRRITQCTYSELQELRLNHTDARIPLFTEVLRIVDGQVPLLIEIKKYDGKPLEEDFERGPFLAKGVDAEGTSAYYADPAVMYAEKN